MINLKIKKDKKSQLELVKKIAKTTFWGLMVLVVVVAMMSIIATITQPKYLPTMSNNIFEFKYIADWIFLIGIVLLIALGGFILYKTLKKQSRWNFIFSNLALIMTSSGLGFIILSFLLPRNTKLTVKTVSQAVKLVNISYFLTFIIIAITTILAVHISRKYIDKNNWYLYFTLLPYIIWAGWTYQQYQHWQNFLATRNFNIEKLTAMFIYYQSHMTKIDMNLMFEGYKSCAFIALLAFIYLLTVGGVYLVFKVKEKVQRKA